MAAFPAFAPSSMLHVVLLALAAAAHVVPKELYKPAVGGYRQCVNGRMHSLKYNTYGVDSTSFIDLDTIHNLEAVSCDLDHTRLHLTFHSEVTSAEWLVRFHDLNTHFLVGGSRWNCSVIQKGRPAVIIRRVVGASMPGAPSKYIDVQASEARYDEIYQDADISFSTEGACDDTDARLGADKHVCVGYNSQCTGSATNSIPIFNNQHVDLECSNCFMDFEMDVFFDLHIRGFEVANLSTGFRDIAVNGSAVMTAKAQANWATGIDKSFPLLQNTYLVNFKVGPVPFMIFFEMPVEMKASLTFNSEADASFGATMNWGFGEAAVSWDPHNHWQHTMPQPKVNFFPTFETHAQLNAEGTFSVVPSLHAHFDRVLSYTLTATPLLDATIQGSEASKQVCLDSTYDLSVKAETVLDINIPWANIAKDWTWDKDVYESGVQKIWQKCVSL